MLKKGLIQVYTGDGKGKTTAAIGQAVRAYGRGLRVIVFQMLKAGGGSGEHLALSRLDPPLPIRPFGSGEFIGTREPTSSEVAAAVAGWQEITAAIGSGDFDLVVVDELSHALNKKLLALDIVAEEFRNKPESVELVLTGRNMPPSILELADLVTEMRLVKHPFEKGIPAREGIEY